MKMNSRFLIVPALVAGLQAASAGDITGTVTLNGTAPEPKIVDMSSVADCSKLHSEPPKLIFYKVDSKNDLADVVVMVKGMAGKSTGESAPPLTLDQKGCEYVPYVAAVQTGQKILIKNSDPVTHNVHSNPIVDGNTPKNQAQAEGGADITMSFKAEEKFLKFNCDIHPWMIAYVTIVDSPYYAVSGADGKYKISNLPPGKYTIQAIHRKANLMKPVEKEIEVKDGANQLDFTIDLPK
jgi:plastocyanin